MKSLMNHPLQLVLLFSLFSLLYAKNESATPAYPYLVVSPSQPVASSDSVTVQVMLGKAANSCLAPTFANMTFVVKQSMLTIYPPIFEVTVRFAMDTTLTDRFCPEIYDPVDYGPRFRLGVLKLGDYMVSSESKTYGTFSVGQGHTLAAEYTPNTGRSATCLVRDRNLVLSLRQAQDVSVMVYDLDGKIHSKGCFKRHIPAGTHTLPLTIGQTPKGMYIVGVSCAEFAKNISVMNAKNEQK